MARRGRPRKHPLPPTDCGVDKPGQSQGFHTPPFAGSNPAPATSAIKLTEDEVANVRAMAANVAWRGPRQGRETVEAHTARHYKELANAADNDRTAVMFRCAADLIETAAKDAAHAEG